MSSAFSRISIINIDYNSIVFLIVIYHCTIYNVIQTVFIKMFINIHGIYCILYKYTLFNCIQYINI